MEQIRRLTEQDISVVSELSSLAGWNQTADDWRMLLRLAPDTCFGLDFSGRVAATATLVCYEKRLGWIGMVLTHPEARGRGFATHLLKHLLGYADALGIATLKLDATDEGKPLYDRLGFVVEQAIERWGGELEELAPNSTRAISPNIELDVRAFGCNRRQLLQELAARGSSLSNSAGHLMTRAGRVASYLGPFVARDENAANELLDRLAIASGDSSKRGTAAPLGRQFFWDLLPGNTAAVRLARTLEFTPRRKLTRMFRGKLRRGQDDLVYASAGFEVG